MDHLTTAAVLIGVTIAAFGACGIGLLIAVVRSERRGDD